MQLHPLNLSKPDSGLVSQPPSPNPLLDTNPFGAVPLSALLQSPATAPHRKQKSKDSVEGPFNTEFVSEAQAPEASPGRIGGDNQHAREPSLFHRQAALQASSFQDLLDQQVSNRHHVCCRQLACQPPTSCHDLLHVSIHHVYHLSCVSPCTSSIMCIDAILKPTASLALHHIASLYTLSLWAVTLLMYTLVFE